MTGVRQLSVGASASGRVVPFACRVTETVHPPDPSDDSIFFSFETEIPMEEVSHGTLAIRRRSAPISACRVGYPVRRRALRSPVRCHGSTGLLRAWITLSEERARYRRSHHVMRMHACPPYVCFNSLRCCIFRPAPPVEKRTSARRMRQE